VRSGTTSYVYGVWGSEASDVWAVGAYNMLHWNGSTWTSVPSGTGSYLYGVWGSGASDVWAVGFAAATTSFRTVLHWNGSAWSSCLWSSTLKPLRGVWGSGASDVWAVGDWGTILERHP